MAHSPVLTTLVFDWGNTLMRTYPDRIGVMADWPYVEAIPGIPLALASLKQSNYKLVVGSNAIDSNASQVRAALNRVEAGQYIDFIFTFHELQTKKPELNFFKTLETRLNVPFVKLVMIGDDWQADCLGAHRAGWRTIWYNPYHLTSPGLLPLHDAEISHMDQLPQTLDSPFPPSWEECFIWLLQAEAPHNLLAHVQTVAAIGYQLALWLRNAGHSVDPILVHRGGLLHDIAKIEARRSGEAVLSHSELGSLRLEHLGQPILAEITRRHQLDAILETHNRPQTMEQILVYFADKLANGSQLVSPDERIMILSRRYPDSAEKIQRTLHPVLEMQATLCKQMNIAEAELLPRLKKMLSNKKD